MAWTGFYGPSYRALIAAAHGQSDLAESWTEAVAHHNDAPIGEGHWEFLACALLHIVDSKAQLDDTYAAWLRAIENKFQTKPPTNNWRLMQQIVRRRLRHEYITLNDLKQAGIVQNREGHLPDANTPSTQYHAYILLLLLRFGDVGSLSIQKVALHAFRWLYEVDESCGDPSPIGRGRFQLFGYASMAAAANEANKYGLEVHSSWLSRVWQRCRSETFDGALSRHWSGPHRRHLLEGYNTVSDYSSFASFWLRGVNAPTNLSKGIEVPPQGLWWHPFSKARGGLLATESSVLLAIEILSLDQGRGLALELLRRAARYIKRPPQTRSVPPDQTIQMSEGLTIRKEQRFVRLISNPGPNSYVTIWVPQSTAVDLRSDGCVEHEQLTWSRDGDAYWKGYAARLVRFGSIEYSCAF